VSSVFTDSSGVVRFEGTLAGAGITAAGVGVPGFDFADTYPNGTLYYDTDGGGLYLRINRHFDVSAALQDPTSLPNQGITQWVRVAGDVDAWPLPGVTIFGNGSITLQSDPGKGAYLSDLMAFVGSGNGIWWNYNGSAVDGEQEAWVQVGANGANAWRISDKNGSLGAPPGGIHFPTADPHIAGAWWDNTGVLTKSSG
jgi:hypothetical protein